MQSTPEKTIKQRSNKTKQTDSTSQATHKNQTLKKQRNANFKDSSTQKTNRTQNSSKSKHNFSSQLPNTTTTFTLLSKFLNLNTLFLLLNIFFIATSLYLLSNSPSTSTTDTTTSTGTFHSYLTKKNTSSSYFSSTSQITDKNSETRMTTTDFTGFLDALDQVRTKNPTNLAAKYLTRELFNTYAPEQQEILVRCVQSGVDNPTSQLGCYAMTPTDYETFNDFFDPLIREYHNASPDSVHETDWDASKVGDKGVLDVTKLGLSELSMRVRVGRNLRAFNLPGKMDKAERIEFEKTMLQAFDKLKKMKDYGGMVYSLTPDFGTDKKGKKIKNPNLIDKKKYDQLVKDHIMFKDMDEDPYLKSAGISSDWPYGRGCYVSKDGQFIIWFGEEDQLRIMCMKKGKLLNEVFDRLRKGLDVIEGIPGLEFAKSTKYGYVTSCPSNLGTGMRASVHIKIPNLTKDVTDTKAKKIAKALGLSVRGVGGEHTPIGADGTVDISPSARLFIKEKDIIANLYKGIELLMIEENDPKNAK